MTEEIDALDLFLDLLDGTVVTEIGCGGGSCCSGCCIIGYGGSAVGAGANGLPSV